jgi:hypothetical protein
MKDDAAVAGAAIASTKCGLMAGTRAAEVRLLSVAASKA